MAKGIELTNHERGIVSSALQTYYDHILDEETDDEAGWTLGAKVASLSGITMVARKFGLDVPEGYNG